MAISADARYGRPRMASRRFTLRGAHLLMWSSPLLLLVLLFTLTTTSTPTATVTTRHSPSTPSTTRTTVATSTTRPSSTSTTTRVTTSEATTVTTSAGSFATRTGSSATPGAPAPAISVATGVVAGHLDPPFGVVDVPLRGPGTWTLSASAPVTATLRCPSVSGPVVGDVVVAGAQVCQLELTTRAPTGSTWQLTPAR